MTVDVPKEIAREIKRLTGDREIEIVEHISEPWNQGETYHYRDQTGAKMKIQLSWVYIEKLMPPVNPMVEAYEMFALALHEHREEVRRR